MNSILCTFTGDLLFDASVNCPIFIILWLFGTKPLGTPIVDL